MKVVSMGLTPAQIQQEIEKTKAIIHALKLCIIDKSLPMNERNQYKADHAQQSTYLYTLLTY